VNTSSQADADVAVIAPLSEMYGRLPLYHSCNLLFIIFTVAAAISTNMSTFIVFRFLMGSKYI
jgi:MFS family permease